MAIHISFEAVIENSSKIRVFFALFKSHRIQGKRIRLDIIYARVKGYKNIQDVRPFYRIDWYFLSYHYFKIILQ